MTASIITNLIEPSVYEEYLDRFGFFKLVDTDGIAESTGVKNFTWPADKLALTYGQGSTVTMLQMIQAYSAIFNDGTMVKPYVIDQVRSSYDDQNVLYQGQTQVVGNPISVETSKQVQQLMYDTANREDGTAGSIRFRKRRSSPRPEPPSWQRSAGAATARARRSFR